MAMMTLTKVCFVALAAFLLIQFYLSIRINDLGFTLQKFLQNGERVIRLLELSTKQRCVSVDCL